jgi:hypothetical protein
LVKRNVRNESSWKTWKPRREFENNIKTPEKIESKGLDWIEVA